MLKKFYGILIILLFILSFSWQACEKAEADPVGFELYVRANPETDIDRLYIYTIETLDTSTVYYWNDMTLLGSFDHDSLLALSADSVLRVNRMFDANGEYIQACFRVQNTSGVWCPTGFYTDWLFKENLVAPINPRDGGIRRL